MSYLLNHVSSTQSSILYFDLVVLSGVNSLSQVSFLPQHTLSTVNFKKYNVDTLELSFFYNKSLRTHFLFACSLSDAETCLGFFVDSLAL